MGKTGKTNKSLRKRLKISGKGKLSVRKAGIGHFNAKKKRTKQLAGKRMSAFTMDKDTLGHYLPNA